MDHPAILPLTMACFFYHQIFSLPTYYIFLSYSFLEFLQKIKDSSLLSEIQFLGFRAIISQHLTSMYDYLEDSNGDNKMAFIFKRESLDNDWKEFCAKYKLEYDPLKYINKTKSITDWKDLYRIYPEASQLVYNLYKKDFEYFGYRVIIA